MASWGNTTAMAAFLARAAREQNLAVTDPVRLDALARMQWAVNPRKGVSLEAALAKMLQEGLAEVRTTVSTTSTAVTSTSVGTTVVLIWPQEPVQVQHTRWMADWRLWALAAALTIPVVLAAKLLTQKHVGRCHMHQEHGRAGPPRPARSAAAAVDEEAPEVPAASGEPLPRLALSTRFPPVPFARASQGHGCCPRESLRHEDALWLASPGGGGDFAPAPREGASAAAGSAALGSACAAAACVGAAHQAGSPNSGSSSSDDPRRGQRGKAGTPSSGSQHQRQVPTGQDDSTVASETQSVGSGGRKASRPSELPAAQLAAGAERESGRRRWEARSENGSDGADSGQSSVIHIAFPGDEFLVSECMSVTYQEI